MKKIILILIVLTSIFLYANYVAKQAEDNIIINEKKEVQREKTNPWADSKGKG